MAIIIVGNLQLQTQAEDAIEQLVGAGFAPEKVTSFFINPPGQHALYPIGGDRYKSPSEEDEADKGTTLGSVFVDVTEAVIGVTNNKDSSADTNKSRGECAIDGAHTNKLPLHRAGMLVAVELADHTYQDKAVTLLIQLGAVNIEKAEGKIVDGEWRDFDPLSEPCYLKS